LLPEIMTPVSSNVKMNIIDFIVDRLS